MNTLMTIDYASIGTGLAVLFIAFMQVWNRYQSDKNHTESKKELNEVKRGTEEVRLLINGPLGTALAASATTSEQLAHLTSDPEMILKAVAARKLSDQHNAEQAEIAAKKTLEESNKAKIIADWKNAEKSKTP